LGICALSYPEKKQRAIEIFKDISSRYKTVSRNITWRVLIHVNYRFDEALAVFTTFAGRALASNKKGSKAMVEDAQNNY